MIPEGAENHIADSKADNESKLPLETQIPKGNRKIIKDLAQKYADEWNNRYPTKAFMKWDDYWSTACTAFDYFNSIKYSEQDLLGRIKELEDGIKWACDNPNSVFVFNTLKKLIQ